VIYQVRHRTIYDYEDSVSVSHHLLRLTPRNLFGQRCEQTEILIDPLPPNTITHSDYFGNTQTFFTLTEPHQTLVVESVSKLEVQSLGFAKFDTSPPWEKVVAELPFDYTEEGLSAYQFVFDSQRAKASRDMGDYARECFLPGRPILEATFDLTRQIYRDFKFDSKATEVSTAVEEVFKHRRGVCQDFAHLQIACLRSLGLPARYISGYLRTLPPPGRPRLVGADASHAWCATWCPGFGWVDFDPTNNIVPTDGHITVAWGRDYSDVSPIHGVLLGGSKHSLEVSVDVMPLDSPSESAADQKQNPAGRNRAQV
jgi:transglutaminase-like putative cysteine protease